MKDLTHIVIRGCKTFERNGFTLIELLITIGILGALAAVLLTSFSTDREELLDSSIVQKELADIQRAFQRMNSDCVLKQDDYKLISRYGLAVLMQSTFLGKWDADKGKGWRGPYLEMESRRFVNTTTVSPAGISTAGQFLDSGGIEIPVLCTPYAEGDSDGNYYRVIPTVDWGPDEKFNTTDDFVAQLWVVFPDDGKLVGVPDPLTDPDDFADYIDAYELKRRLLLEGD